MRPIRVTRAENCPAPDEERGAEPPATRGPQARPGLGLHLRYSFEPGEQQGAALGNPLFELLAAVAEAGSIRHAARTLGASYRYVWDSLRNWERVLGEPLISWSQGRRARPTEFALKLLWAERRVRERMQPHIEALRCDLAGVLADARDGRQQLLTLRASHDLALPVLQRHVAVTSDLHLKLVFTGSADALRSLSAGECLVAGFHVPRFRDAPAVFVRTLKPLLKPRVHRLIACSQRMQGLMLRKEHAAVVKGLADIIRLRLRFANRQPGSGTRMLIDHLLEAHAAAPESLPGYREHIEHSHVAVALCIASGVADAGVGVEAAALQFGLHFVPIIEENYFLACLESSLGHPGVGRLREVLSGRRWGEILASLPGYRPAAAPGDLLALEDVLPWWRRRSVKQLA